MESERGICPQCELPGSVGDPCSERACALRHVHCIPALYHDEIRKQPHEFRDPQIGLVIDSHLIVGKLGEGGFGSVYLVLQLPIMMKAALKLMNLKLSKDPVVIQKLIKKFETEARSLAQLDHPNIVRLVRYGHLHDRPYLVMEYVANARSLRDEVLHRIAEGRGFDLETLGALLDQVLSALQRAHALQIVHRDIKPDNIMLQRVDERFFVRVLDFGLSKFTAESELTSIIAGTPVYMAPEQIVQRNLGPWTDLYAVAAMTFELLTGKRPFTGATSQEIYQKKLDVRYDPCTMLPTQYRIPRLVEFFSKSMAQKPELRFQDVPSFRSALQSIFSELAEREQPLEPATDLGELNSQEDSGSSDTGVAQTTPGHLGARAEVRVDEATPSPSMSGLPQLAARPARSRSVELAKPVSSNVPTSADATTSVSTEISGGAPTRASRPKMPRESQGTIVGYGLPALAARRSPKATSPPSKAPESGGPPESEHIEAAAPRALSTSTSAPVGLPALVARMGPSDTEIAAPPAFRDEDERLDALASRAARSLESPEAVFHGGTVPTPSPRHEHPRPAPSRGEPSRPTSSDFSFAERPAQDPAITSGFELGELPASDPGITSGFTLGELPAQDPTITSGFELGELPPGDPGITSGFTLGDTPLSGYESDSGYEIGDGPRDEHFVAAVSRRRASSAAAIPGGAPDPTESHTVAPREEAPLYAPSSSSSASATARQAIERSNIEIGNERLSFASDPEWADVDRRQRSDLQLPEGDREPSFAGLDEIHGDPAYAPPRRSLALRIVWYLIALILVSGLALGVYYTKAWRLLTVQKSGPHSAPRTDEPKRAPSNDPSLTPKPGPRLIKSDPAPPKLSPSP